jgi:hypothetical protein
MARTPVAGDTVAGVLSCGACFPYDTPQGAPPATAARVGKKERAQSATNLGANAGDRGRTVPGEKKMSDSFAGSWPALAAEALASPEPRRSSPDALLPSGETLRRCL